MIWVMGRKAPSASLWMNYWYQYRMRYNQLERSIAEKALEGLVDIKLSITQQCIRKDVARGWREVILPLYLVRVKLHLGCHVQFWASQFRGSYHKMISCLIFEKMLWMSRQLEQFWTMQIWLVKKESG